MAGLRSGGRLGWRGSSRGYCTAADDFTRADPRWQAAQRKRASPLPLAVGEVYEFPRRRRGGIVLALALVLGFVIIWAALR